MRQICFIDSTVFQTHFNSADNPDIARPFGKDTASSRGDDMIHLDDI